MLSVAVNDSFAKSIDGLIAKSGMYSSRSEFLKDSIRKNVVELMKHDPGLWKIHQESEKAYQRVKRRGMLNHRVSKKELDRMALDSLRKKGLLIED